MNFWQRLWVAIKPTEDSRIKYIYKHHIFRTIGENLIFVPRLLPPEPEYIMFHDNVVVAAGVSFITHDVSHFMYNNLYNSKLKYYHGCIEVGNNVFIGSHSIILPNVQIGDNTIIAAGAIVTKDIPGDGVYGGVPACKIGEFEDLFHKREQLSIEPIDDVEYCWEIFQKNKKQI